MTWRVGLRPREREIVICWGASNVVAHSATTPTTNYRSGHLYTPVNLATPNSLCQFATYKDSGIQIINPISRSWGPTEPFGDQGGGALGHSLELATARHGTDRNRKMGIITVGVAGEGADSFSRNPTKNVFENFVTTQLNALNEPYRVVAIVGYCFLADTASESIANAFATNLTSVFTSITNAIGSPAANAAWIMVEPHDDIVTTSGTWGPTALNQYNTFMSTIVPNHKKYKIPTNAAAAQYNDTGESVTSLDFSSIHPGSATQDGLGDRLGDILHRSIFQEFTK